MPSPLKRWYGIGAQPRLLNGQSCAMIHANSEFCTESIPSKRAVRSVQTMQLSTCNMVAARVPQGNRRGERSMQLVGGSRLLIPQGARVETINLYMAEQWLRNL